VTELKDKQRTHLPTLHVLVFGMAMQAAQLSRPTGHSIAKLCAMATINKKRRLHGSGTNNPNINSTILTKDQNRSSVNAFGSALKASLDQNRRLQFQIITALESLSHQKAVNRNRAAKLTRELYLQTEGFPRENVDNNQEHVSPAISGNAYAGEVRTLLESFAKPKNETNATSEKIRTGSVEEEEASTEVDKNMGESPTGATETITAETAPVETQETTAFQEASKVQNSAQEQHSPTIASPQPVAEEERNTQRVQSRARRQLSQSRKALEKTWGWNLYWEEGNKVQGDPLNRPFFTDPIGSTPESNADTLYRRQIEIQVQDREHLPDLSPPWTKTEDKLLEALVKAALEEVAKAPDANAESSRIQDEPQVTIPKIDFEKIAEKLEKKRKSDNTNAPRKQPRTAQECFLQYQRLQDEKQPRMTKAEESKVLKEVQKYHKTTTTVESANLGSNDKEHEPNSDVNDFQDEYVDWEAVARAVGNSRSPWQCFATYQRLRPACTYPSIAASTAPRKLVWTPKQDEILLTYIAANGPQFLLDMDAVTEMSRNFFPDKSAKQILLRASQTMVNVKFRQGAWTTREERKLVLAQKIYRKDSVRLSVQFPTRSPRSVREKWNRTLDPAYNKARPFSKQEDQRLVQVVRDELNTPQLKTNYISTSGISWFEIAREHFPDRRPEQIQMRWMYELASNDDLLRKMKVDLLAQNKLHGKNKDDFVLKVAKKKQGEKPGQKNAKRKR